MSDSFNPVIISCCSLSAADRNKDSHGDQDDSIPSDIITLSPDPIPFDSPANSGIIQKIGNTRVISIIDLEDSPIKTDLASTSVNLDANSNFCISSAVVDTISLDDTADILVVDKPRIDIEPPSHTKDVIIIDEEPEDPLQVVVTLPDSPTTIIQEDSPIIVLDSKMASKNKENQPNKTLLEDPSHSKNSDILQDANGTIGENYHSSSDRKIVKPTTLSGPSERMSKDNYTLGLTLFEDVIKIIESTTAKLKGAIISSLRKKLDNSEKKYLYSKLFVEMLQDTIQSANENPTKIFSYIKKLSDELKLNAKITESKKEQSNDISQNDDATKEDEDEGLDEKTRCNIKKLEKLLKKLNDKIKTLEETDVFDPDEDDENNAYIKEDRYKKKYMEVLNTIQKLRKTKFRIGRHGKLSFKGTEHETINKAIERYYNKTKKFPDCQDILKLVKEVSDTSLKLNSREIESVGIKAFTTLGAILQERRFQDDYDILTSRIQHTSDPAEEDPELLQKLEENKKYWKNEDEVIKKFVDIENARKAGKADDLDTTEEDEEEEEEDDGDEYKEDDGDDDNSDDDDDDDNNDNRCNEPKRTFDSPEQDEDDSQSEEEGKSSHKKRRLNTDPSKGKQQSNTDLYDKLLKQFNVRPCRVKLDHSSSTLCKKEIFINYLKLQKKLKGETSENELEENNECKSEKNILKSVDEGKNSETSDLDAIQLDAEKKPKKIMSKQNDAKKQLSEDQISCITSTTEPTTSFVVTAEVHSVPHISIEYVSSTIDDENVNNSGNELSPQNKVATKEKDKLEKCGESDHREEECDKMKDGVDNCQVEFTEDQEECEEEDVNEILKNLQECVVELKTINTTKYLSEPENEDSDSSSSKPKEILKKKSKLSDPIQTTLKRNQTDQKTASELSSEEDSVNKKHSKSNKKNKISGIKNDKKKRKRSSEEESDEEEDDDSESDNSSDYDYNPYDDIKSMKEHSKKKSLKRRKKSNTFSSPRVSSTTNNYQPHIRGNRPRPLSTVRPQKEPILNYNSTATRKMEPKSSYSNSYANRPPIPQASPLTVPRAQNIPYKLPPGITLTPRFQADSEPIKKILNLKGITLTKCETQASRSKMGPASSKLPKPNMGPASSKLPNSNPNVNFSNRSQNPTQIPTQRSQYIPPSMHPKEPITQEHSKKTFIRGGIQLERNKLSAHQSGTVHNLTKVQTINSKQRILGSVHEQQIKMKHTVNKDQLSGAGQDERVTENIERTINKDGKKILRKTIKTTITNVEVEETIVDPNVECINLDD